ncbi:unnamed protein product [Effrenium voratum]|uniref:J domain-containing protein n=1 Tax=Effrenium voratum TaxID=2562239 RepID=A0AA36MHV4_9DINO|nr:unnamed protein product [Effrenium voratum]
MPSPPNPPDVDSEEFRSRRRIAEASSWQQVLGVTSTCPESELKKAYRTLALLHHPDKATSEAAATFRAVQRAYEEGLAQQREAKAASLAKPNEVVEASDSERQQWPVHPCASKAHVRAAVDQWEHAYDLGEVPSVPDDVPEVCAAELASWLREGRCVAMDCREPTEAHYERRVPAIPAQLSAPFGQLTGAPERLAPQLARLKAAQTHVVAFSTHGGTSGNCGMCAALLIDVFGMDATRFWRLEGGVDEWIDWAAAHPDAVAQLPAPTI